MLAARRRSTRRRAMETAGTPTSPFPSAAPRTPSTSRRCAKCVLPPSQASNTRIFPALRQQRVPTTAPTNTFSPKSLHQQRQERTSSIRIPAATNHRSPPRGQTDSSTSRRRNPRFALSVSDESPSNAPFAVDEWPSKPLCSHSSAAPHRQIADAVRAAGAPPDSDPRSFGATNPCTRRL